MPAFAIFVVGLGVLCYAVLYWALELTAVGKLMKSLASDPCMAGMLGINVPCFYTWIVVIGFYLAILAGGLLATRPLDGASA
jgi:branched-chain amino acid transport system permease protein